MDIDFERRFWARVRRDDSEDGCWVWTGSLMTRGYGRLWVKGRREGAHRVAYEIAYGPFDKALRVLHHCDNPPCVRPKHLFLGTQLDNMRDAARKGRMTNCYRWTSENNPNKGKPLPDYICDAVGRAHERPFRVRAPDGEVIEGINLTKYCREHGLNQGGMWSVINGLKPHYRGYTPVYYPRIK